MVARCVAHWQRCGPSLPGLPGWTYSGTAVQARRLFYEAKFETKTLPGGVGSVGDVRGVHGLLEHRKQRGIDVRRRVRRVVEIRRGAGLQRGWNAGDVAVGVAVLVIENRAGIRDWLVGNVEDRDGDAAILDGGAIIGCR